MSERLITPLTELLGIKHPILLAGMGGVAHHRLVAAVSQAGGLGTIGGALLTPKMLRREIALLKKRANDDNVAFGVDLLIAKIGGSARKTNHDYTHGKLAEMVDIIIAEGARLFVSAVGVPPEWVVEKFHAANIPVMNMCGHPKHVEKALAVGCDIVCCQGTEGGGHTGEIGTSVLVPQCVDICKGRVSKLTGGPIHVVAAGGVYNGRGLAASLSWGAEAVWVGTRFVACKESHASPRHKKAILNASATDTVRTVIYSGRPLRVIRTEHAGGWEEKQDEIQKLTAKGIVPFIHEIGQMEKRGEEFDVSQYPMLVGQCCGPIDEIKTAGEIINEMVQDAIAAIKQNRTLIAKL